MGVNRVKQLKKDREYQILKNNIISDIYDIVMLSIRHPSIVGSIEYGLNDKYPMFDIRVSINEEYEYIDWYDLGQNIGLTVLVDKNLIIDLKI